MLGARAYAMEEAEKEPEVGAVTGLAWTATGGELMTIEALRMPGTGKLTVTGQLGDVMRESVDAAYSFVRSRAGHARASPRHPEFRESDLHLHFPAGAIPKDGPSAGIAVTLAMASVLSRPGAARRGPDRRGHAARQGARDRRREGEGAGRVSRRPARSDPAQGQREGPARRPGRGAQDGVHLREHAWTRCCCCRWRQGGRLAAASDAHAGRPALRRATALAPASPRAAAVPPARQPASR
jgi:hypothetical protein